MSGISTASELKQAVIDYKRKEKEVSRNFILGIIELGEEMEKTRAKFKQGRVWMTYLREINKTLPWANQMIRLYEYSLKNKAAVQKADLTNWAKLNLFLTVPEEQRSDLSKRIGGAAMSNDGFRKAVVDTTQKEGKERKIDEAELSRLVPEKDIKKLDNELKKSLNEALLEKPGMLANAFIKATKKTFPIITDNSTEAAKAFYSVEASISFLGESQNLSPEEKAFWKEKLTSRLEILQDCIKNLQ